MKTSSFRLLAWATMMFATLLSVFSTRTLADQQQTFALGSQPPTRKGRTHAAFNKNNSIGWRWVNAQCPDPTGAGNYTVGCAQAAILEATTECAESAKFFRKGSTTWQWIGFALMMSSAGFTAVGASTTVAGAKVWSTLGGTTGLGAVTTTLNSNATADQNAVLAVNAVLVKLNTFVTTPGTTPGQIFETAPIYAGECEAIANGSSGSTPPLSSPATQVAPPGAPTSVQATSSSAGTATVTFTAPTTGGAAVSYAVTATPTAAGANTPVTVTGTGISIAVTGLTTGASYTFAVTGTNAGGPGPTSTPSSPVTIK